MRISKGTLWCQTVLCVAAQLLVDRSPPNLGELEKQIEPDSDIFSIRKACIDITIYSKFRINLLVNVLTSNSFNRAFTRKILTLMSNSKMYSLRLLQSNLRLKSLLFISKYFTAISFFSRTCSFK